MIGWLDKNGNKAISALVEAEVNPTSHVGFYELA